MMMGLYLDMHSIEAFLKVAELNSFTLAAESLCITQSGVTVKIQKLENMLGYPLFHRTPRHIYLSPQGEAFLSRAKSLMVAHTSALTTLNVGENTQNIKIGISDHVLDTQLMQTIKSIRQTYSDLMIEVKVESSSKVLHALENKKIDIAIITQDGDKKGGEYLRNENYRWYCSPTLAFKQDKIPLITLRESCRMRKLILDLLLEARTPWFDSFQGGGMDTIIAAAKSGLGIVPLPDTALTVSDLKELTDASHYVSLPKIPSAHIVTYNNCLDLRSRSMLKDLAQAIKNQTVKMPDTDKFVSLGSLMTV
ncbi:LysR family transcriptional regulator [Serratia sp. root2]|uniref:LysR family transcriptional regulator n=1 Tax=Serratia sp. root2 TaxID=3059676 RepID=UPI0028905146|nr:LysR family transcriptional regulator [Serratia sp. root2]MDT3249625.1 LysR family transcriptional regulator [Serratia sp. root2]